MEEDENQELSFPIFSADGLTDGDAFAIHYRSEIADAVFLAVRRMIKHGLDEVPVFMIEETESVFMLDRLSSTLAVNGCIEYYTEIEEYELCSELSQLKAKL